MALRQYRDLDWCIRSPGLVRASDLYPEDAWYQQLALPDTVDGNFPIPKHPNRFRLGLQFERIWQYWFEHTGTTSLLSANLQVREPHHTVGEFDFIVEHEGVTEHWEVAVKFYLGCHDTANIEHWYGPNTSDRLALKLSRLHGHQLQLGQFEAARVLLAEQDLNIARVRGLVKGRLFYPWDQFEANRFHIAAELNPTHQKGWWLDLDSFRERTWKNVGFLVISKQWWLAPISSDDEVTPVNKDQLIGFLENEEAEQATHVALLDQSGCELSRGFVVNQGWLNKVGL